MKPAPTPAQWAQHIVDCLQSDIKAISTGFIEACFDAAIQIERTRLQATHLAEVADLERKVRSLELEAQECRRQKGT